MAASTLSLSSIVTPSSSSSSSTSTSLSSTHFHSFTYFSPKPSKLPFKTLALKPLTLLSPLLRHRSAALSAVAGELESQVSEEDTVIDESDELSVGEDDEDDDGDGDGDVAVKGGSVSSSDDGRVYVGNLPYTLTSSQLSEIFSRAGQIKSVEIIYDKMTDRSRGFGFVTMETVDEANEVIRMFDGSQVGGRTVRVNFPEVPKGGERKVMGSKIQMGNQSFVDTPHKIYAGNLGWGVSTKGLKDAFGDQPEFVSAKVIFERDTGRSRGFGFVSFQSAEAAQAAINAMDGVELEGRPLRLNFAAERSRPNTESATE